MQGFGGIGSAHVPKPQAAHSHRWIHTGQADLPCRSKLTSSSGTAVRGSYRWPCGCIARLATLFFWTETICWILVTKCCQTCPLEAAGACSVMLNKWWSAQMWMDDWKTVFLLEGDGARAILEWLLLLCCRELRRQMGVSLWVLWCCKERDLCCKRFLCLLRVQRCMPWWKRFCKHLASFLETLHGRLANARACNLRAWRSKSRGVFLHDLLNQLLWVWHLATSGMELSRLSLAV